MPLDVARRGPEGMEVVLSRRSARDGGEGVPRHGPNNRDWEFDA
ncbi:MAG: hypothetical protein AAFQ43_12665 [Bacteroidota bacterium]